MPAQQQRVADQYDPEPDARSAEVLGDRQEGGANADADGLEQDERLRSVGQHLVDQRIQLLPPVRQEQQREVGVGKVEQNDSEHGKQQTGAVAIDEDLLVVFEPSHMLSSASGEGVAGEHGRRACAPIGRSSLVLGCLNGTGCLDRQHR